MSDEDKKGKAHVAHAELLNLSSYLPYHLSVAVENMSAQSSQLIEQKTGLSMTEWRVLGVISSFKPLSVRNVATFTSMSKVAVSRAVTRLCSLELVSKEMDVKDNRLVSLTLTPNGHEVYRSISKLLYEWSGVIFSVFTEQELATWKSLSSRLQQELKKFEHEQKEKGA